MYFTIIRGRILRGGGIFIENSGATILNNIIQNNIMENDLESEIAAYGGGIESTFLDEDKTLNISDNIFRNNSLKGVVAIGGGIDIWYPDGKLKIERNRLIENRVKAKNSAYGGAICIMDGGSDDLLIQNNYIAKNSIVGYARGGGIACQDVSPTIRNNIIVKNSALVGNDHTRSGHGGGISMKWNRHEKKFDPYIIKAVIENNTILYNTSTYAGAGIYVVDSDAEIVNNIIYFNKPRYSITSDTKQVRLRVEELDSDKIFQNVGYSNIEGGFNGEGNINVVPNFIDTVYYRLKENEAECIDAGDPLEKYEDTPDPIFANLPRAPALGSLRNDMGAFGGPHSKWAEMEIITNLEEMGKEVIPNQPFLSQNYPNPFNPITTIKYSIPINEKRETRNVKLIVYDILGREISTIVNEKQKPGNYEVKFHTSNLPSGVYYYSMKIGNFLDVKKMILLK